MSVSLVLNSQDLGTVFFNTHNRLVNQQQFDEVEVANGGYFPTRKAGR